nr:uncharacterized protein LOC100000753 isoform X1 [Danio rerio]|eukprot:XP_009298984.1 uncharacterized protein LOC100000753 isoform X1 [Danio rerio]
MDSAYVNRCLGVCLAEGLAELIEHRPQEPIEYLALWIRSYREKQRLQEQRSAFESRLKEEKQRLHDESLHQQLLQEEQKQIRAAQEEIKVNLQQAEAETVSKMRSFLRGHVQYCVLQHTEEPQPESAEQSKATPADSTSSQAEEQVESVEAPADQPESDTVKEQTDPALNEEESGETAGDEEQSAEIQNTEQSLSQEDLGDTPKENNEADVQSEENKPELEQTEEEADEGQIEAEEKVTHTAETEDTAAVEEAGQAGEQDEEED